MHNIPVIHLVNEPLKTKDIYRKLYKQKYHLIHKWKVNSLKTFIQSFIDGKLSELKYPFSFTLIFFKTLIFYKYRNI